MNNWLQKFMAPKAPVPVKRNFPARIAVKPPAKTPAKLVAAFNPAELTRGLPPATIIYGAAAGAFITFALFLFVGSHWLDGALTLLPAACFVGFAVHLMNGEK